MSIITMEKKVGTITIVTPPTLTANKKQSICLINFTKEDKDVLVHSIDTKMEKNDITLYFFNEDNFYDLSSFKKYYNESFKNYNDEWKPFVWGVQYKPKQRTQELNWLFNNAEHSICNLINKNNTSNQIQQWIEKNLPKNNTHFFNFNKEINNIITI